VPNLRVAKVIMLYARARGTLRVEIISRRRDLLLDLPRRNQLGFALAADGRSSETTAEKTTGMTRRRFCSRIDSLSPRPTDAKDRRPVCSSVATMPLTVSRGRPVLADGREFVAEVSVSSSCTREKGYLHCEKQSFAS